MSLPSDMVEDIRTAAGSRGMSAWVERAIRHEMLAAPYDVSAADEALADVEALHDEARGW